MKNTSRKFAYGHVIIHVLTLLMFAVLSLKTRATEMPKTVIRLNGTAQGGVLSLMEIQPIAAGFASVVTTQGESSEVVLSRMADEICRSDAFNWQKSAGILRPLITVRSNTLTLPLSALRLCFTGTDKGFVSLKPVLSVSGSYDVEKHQVSLSWINPPETYDLIRVGTLTFPPDTTNCVYACEPGNREHMSFGLVIAKQGDNFSPPASVIINTNSQEELDTFPFYMGLAPNWSYWSDSTNADAVKCEQGIKAELDMHVRGDPWDKPLYQVIKTTQGGAQGGVCRRFLGLKPNHTYKVEVRMNTLQMDACTNAWAYSFHASCDNHDGNGLTVAQMAGRAALPDGSKGPEAGCVAVFGPRMTTNGKWLKRPTVQPGSSLKLGSIALTNDVTSITVWLRHSGTNSTGVGMDWIKLTDVTAGK